MNPNTTPTSRRNRPDTPQPQEDQELGFQAFSQPGYHPNFAPQQFPQQFPHQFSQQFTQQFPGNFPGQIPYPFTYPGLLQQGYTPAQFSPLPSPAFNLDDDDTVPETQPSTPHTPQSIPIGQSIPEPSNPRPTRKEKTRQYENRASKKKWTKQEEVALVSAWVDVSEDPVIGNAQTGGHFWNRITQLFLSSMDQGNYRTKDQIYTKFKELNRRISQFAGIYNNLVNNRSSGMSDADILRTAYDRYRDDNGLPFTSEAAWEVLKKCPKWATVPTMTTNSSRGSKRTKPSDDDDEDVNEVEVEQLQRPIGRNKAKKTSTGSTAGSLSDENVSKWLASLNAFNVRTDDAMDYKMKKLELENSIEREKLQLESSIEREKLQLEREKLELEREREREQRFDKDFEFFITPHDHLTGDVLKATLAKKERIRKYHNF